MEKRTVTVVENRRGRGGPSGAEAGSDIGGSSGGGRIAGPRLRRYTL